MPVGIKPPSVLFEMPLCAEVMGAGFQRLQGSMVSCFLSFLSAYTSCTSFVGHGFRRSSREASGHGSMVSPHSAPKELRVADSRARRPGPPPRGPRVTGLHGPSRATVISREG
jgi:hypothetical protein